jgi:hypothetical protein
MKHITEKWGQHENHIICTVEEFEILKKAFMLEGVRIRAVIYGQNKVEFQIINPYKDWATDDVYELALRDLNDWH